MECQFLYCMNKAVWCITWSTSRHVIEEFLADLWAVGVFVERA